MYSPVVVAARSKATFSCVIGPQFESRRGELNLFELYDLCTDVKYTQYVSDEDAPLRGAIKKKLSMYHPFVLNKQCCTENRLYI
jgi:hypothetical protein